LEGNAADTIALPIYNEDFLGCLSGTRQRSVAKNSSMGSYTRSNDICHFYHNSLLVCLLHRLLVTFTAYVKRMIPIWLVVGNLDHVEEDAIIHCIVAKFSEPTP